MEGKWKEALQKYNQITVTHFLSWTDVLNISVCSKNFESVHGFSKFSKFQRKKRHCVKKIRSRIMRLRTLHMSIRLWILELTDPIDITY